MAELIGEVGAPACLHQPLHKVRESLSRLDAPRDLAIDLDATPEVRRGQVRGESEAALRDSPLRVQVARALDAYATHGPKAAYETAKNIFGTAKAVAETLESLGDEEGYDGQAGRAARAGILAALRDVDVGLFEGDALGDLLRLGPGAEAIEANVTQLARLRDRVASWIVARESSRDEGADVALGQRRLRALLHLVDGAASTAATLQSASMLLRGFCSPLPAGLVRANAAALARALEALVRTESIEPVDALLAALHEVTSPTAFIVLAEASMDDDLRHAFKRAAAWLAALAADEEFAPQPLDALSEWTREIVLDPSSRAESLRIALLRAQHCLSLIAAAPSLRSLASGGTHAPEAVVDLEAALDQIAQLAHGARGRLAPEHARSAYEPRASQLSLSMSRVLSGASDALEAPAASLVGPLLGELPAALARLVTAALAPLDALPLDHEDSGPASVVTLAALPAWLPARRTLGGFYVQRPLGSGGASSVFIVNRVEDRRDPRAERFALKVPDYSASTARALSELEFLQIFREEASALITLPQHPNLARFVTFDTAARPKPILVMELVEGPNLEQVVGARGLPTARWFSVLDDILAGLEVMHAAGLAHLDVKPSNVVLREGSRAVLVDFGLAGRKIRAGCASGPYGAPEVWGVTPPSGVVDATKADIYAFACLAFEVLTGAELFTGTSELELVSRHLAHDGFPDPLRLLARQPMLAPLSEILFAALRRDPIHRPAAARVRAELRRVAPPLMKAPWPLSA
jgi:hypothetical protein